MSANTTIEWADHTFNPWTGCMKVGPGCDHCYAEGWSKRAGAKVGKWGAGAPRVRTSAANWKLPMKWEAGAEAFQAAHGRRQRVFCASLADVFDNEVDPQWRYDLFNLILSTPGLDWLLLTKRIGNAAQMIQDTLPENMKALPADCPVAWPWPHVWLGATVVNQEEADRDIPKLLATPARVRFLSMEPLLGPVRIDCWLKPIDLHPRPDPWGRDQALDWIIAGGESGPGARPSHPQWFRDLRDQCAAAGTPFLFKQNGEWLPWLEFGRVGIDDEPEQTRYQTTIWQDDHWEDCGRPLWCDMNDNYGGGASGPEDSDQIMGRVGKKAAGRLLDGVTHDGFPS